MMCAFSFPYLDCIMRWIDLFVESGTISCKLYHAVDRFVFGIVPDGFLST
jgi:hypothetical protein